MNKYLVYWLVGMAAILTGDTALHLNNIIVAVIFYTVFLAVTILVSTGIYRGDEKEYRRRKREREEFNRYATMVEKHDELLCSADKPDKSPTQNVRPGSNPSIKYLNMVVEREKGEHK